MRRSDVFHRTVLESEGAAGVRVTDCSLPLRCNAYIEGQRLSGGMRSKGLLYGAEMQKVGDTGDISLLFFLAGANFLAILGHFWAILTILGHFWAN